MPNNQLDQRQQQLCKLLALLLTLVAFFLIQDEPAVDDELGFNEEQEEAIAMHLYTEQLPYRAKQTPRPKSTAFWHVNFPLYTDLLSDYNGFKKHFRMTRHTFENLCARLSRHPVYQPSTRPQIPIERQVAIVLWRLATGQGIRELEQDKGISQGSVSHFTDRFLKALLDTSRDVIRWPTGNRINDIKQGFANIVEPGSPTLRDVLGAVDGSHIRIWPHSERADKFYNRKCYPSVVLMAICDHEGRFTYVYTGEPGSVHDSRVFQRSRFWNAVQQDPAQ
jgi:hypothetical protein